MSRPKWEVPVEITTWLGKTKRRVLRISASDEWMAQRIAGRQAALSLTDHPLIHPDGAVRRRYVREVTISRISVDSARQFLRL